MFGRYKHALTETLVENYTNKKNFKKSFHSLMQGLKENKTAREFFVLYGEIENKKFINKSLAEEYLNVAIKTLKSKRKNLKLPSINKQGENEIYSKIDSLVFNESVRSIEDNIKNKYDLIEHLMTEKEKSTIKENLNTGLLSSMISKNYNKKYSNLTESDRNKLKEMLTMDKKVLKKEINELKESVTTKINSLISENKNTNVVDKLNTTKNKVKNMGYFPHSIFKLNKLKNDLN